MSRFLSTKGLTLAEPYMAKSSKEASDTLAGHACLSCGKVGQYISGDKGKLRSIGEVRYYKVGMKCVCGFINFVYLLENDIARLKKNRIPASSDALRQAIESGSIPDARLDLMMLETKVLAYQGKLLEATDQAKSSVQQYPDSAAAQYNLGYLLASCGQVAEALGHYRRSVQCDPTFSSAWYRIGLLLEEMKSFEEALSGYDKFLGYHPNHAEALSRRQRCLEKLTKQDDQREMHI